MPTPIPELKQKEVVVYNGVSSVEDSQNYFKVENTDPDAPIEVLIFNEMGIKVYESSHYQEKGALFHGYANMSGVVGKGQRLPSGTYFYIFTIIIREYLIQRKDICILDNFYYLVDRK